MLLRLLKPSIFGRICRNAFVRSIGLLKPGGTFLICNEVSGDEAKDEKWTKIIEGMTIYKDTELKIYLGQAMFRNIQIRKKGIIGCALRRKSEEYYVKKRQRNFSVWQ